MPRIALLVCLAFIAWLLVRDSKRHSSVSSALWIPTLMVLVLGSRNPAQWLGGSYLGADRNGVSGNLWDQAFFLLVIGGCFVIASSRGVRWNRLFVANAGIMVFYLYFVLSSIWSDFPADSLIRVSKDFGTTVLVISAILSEKDPQEAIRTVFARCACVLLPFSVLLTKYNYLGFGRNYARDGSVMYTGVTVQKNSLGELVMLASLFLIWDYLETRPKSATRPWSAIGWDRLVLLLMGAWLLDVSGSKTSLVCFSIGLVLMLSGWLASRTFSRVVLVMALSLPFLVLLTQQFGSILTPVLGVLGRDATFTGRTDIWKHIDLTTVNPLIGAGFYNFWGGKGGQAIREIMQTDVPNAHDGYLDLYLDGGAIGLAILFGLLFATGRRIIKKVRDSLYQRMRFVVLVVAIVTNLTESNFARPSLLWFTLILMLIEFPVLNTQEVFASNVGASSIRERLEPVRNGLRTGRLSL
jgi:exopolysaccharide production protein ExoQ